MEHNNLNKMTTKTNFVFGEEKTDFKSLNQQNYVPHKYKAPTDVKEVAGSWLFYFGLNQAQQQQLIVDKGSICINGVSLTVVACTAEGFYVTIIPYTYEHTSFKDLKAGDKVNLEFDILGKYIQKQLKSLRI
jgi:riboflavin synthase alpha subunit